MGGIQRETKDFSAKTCGSSSPQADLSIDQVVRGRVSGQTSWPNLTGQHRHECSGRRLKHTNAYVDLHVSLLDGHTSLLKELGFGTCWRDASSSDKIG